VAAPGGEEFVTALLDEIQAIAQANDNAARPHVMTRIRAMLTEHGSGFAASMLRDIESGGRIEADHIIGDLLLRGREKGIDTPRLAIAYAHLKAYEGRRMREVSA
jgi:2-dehydropantoate 2-reductase